MIAAPISIALAVTIALMLALRPMAFGIGLVDKPGGRKSHDGEIPITGGLAMFGGILFGFALIPAIAMPTWHLLLAGALLVIVGILDDRFTLPASVRMIAQTCAVIIMVYGGGLIISSIGDPLWIGEIFLGRATFPLTVLITLTTVNAFNLSDGVDGLAGSLAITALVPLMIIGGMNAATTVVAGVVCAAIVGFLVFNFPANTNRRLRSFMGDAGSTLLGFIIVWITIVICQAESRLASPVICLWFVAVPIYDLFTCMVRRIVKRKSPFSSGREHIHHTLCRAGLPDSQVLTLIAGLSILYTGFGLFGFYADIQDSLMFTIWAVVGLSQHVILKRFAVLYRRRRIMHSRAPA